MDIEKDIEILKKFNSLNILYGRLALTEEEYNQIKQAIENILAEREADKERIKELESKLEEANKQLDLDYVDENYIPVQKVIDKIDELEEKMGYEDNEKVLVYLHKQRKVLKELLEGK